MACEILDMYVQEGFIEGFLYEFLQWDCVKSYIQKVFLKHYGERAQPFEELYKDVLDVLIESESNRQKQAEEQGIILGRIMQQIETGCRKSDILEDVRKKYKLADWQFEQLHQDALNRIHPENP